MGAFAFRERKARASAIRMQFSKNQFWKYESQGLLLSEKVGIRMNSNPQDNP
jgi:hypothetical protein